MIDNRWKWYVPKNQIFVSFKVIFIGVGVVQLLHVKHRFYTKFVICERTLFTQCAST